MKSITTLLALAACSMTLIACGPQESKAEPDSAQSGRSVPPVVADLPFPTGADLKVTTTDTSGARQHIVSFSFSGSAASVYEDFKSYAADHGYSLATEDQENYRFSSIGDSSQSLVVDISEMGSVNVGTATLMVPPE